MKYFISSYLILYKTQLNMMKQYVHCFVISRSGVRVTQPVPLTVGFKDHSYLNEL